jgi:hypothetical protein
MRIYDCVLLRKTSFAKPYAGPAFTASTERMDSGFGASRRPQMRSCASGNDEGERDRNPRAKATGMPSYSAKAEYPVFNATSAFRRNRPDYWIVYLRER